MNESNLGIILDVLAREIELLRFQVKATEEENAKLRAMIAERNEKHE